MFIFLKDDLEYLRHTSEKERWNLTSQLAQKEEIIRHLEERIAVLTHRTEADCQALGAQLSADERVRGIFSIYACLIDKQAIVTGLYLFSSLILRKDV